MMHALTYKACIMAKKKMNISYLWEEDVTEDTIKLLRYGNVPFLFFFLFFFASFYGNVPFIDLGYMGVHFSIIY